MSTLGVIVLILFLLIILTTLISGFIIYLQYCNSQVKKWSRQVLTSLGYVRRRLRTEQRSYEKLEDEKRAEVASLTEKAFRKCLARIPVARLQEYPGIGPGTVEKLREGGFDNLAHLRGASIRIHGLGEKRLTDIRAAVAHLTKESLGQFEAGASAEARELAEQTAALDLHYDRLDYVTKSRVKAIEGVMRQFEELADYARNVTFLRYFRPITETPPVPLEIQEAPLPDVDALVQAAIDEANKVYARASQKATKRPLAEARPAPPEAVAVAVPVAKVVSTASTKGGSAYPTPSPATRPNVARPKPLPPDARAGRQPVGQFDRERLPPVPPQPMTDEQRHLRIMEATIQFAFLAARLDGPAKAETIALIREHVHERFAYNSSLYNHAKGFLAHYEAGAIDREKCLRSVLELCTSEHRAILLQLAEQITSACGTPTPTARRALVDWHTFLGIPNAAEPLATSPAIAKSATVNCAAQNDQKSAEFPTSPTEAEYRSLLNIELTVTLSPELVRRRYRKRLEELDPEKAKSMGPNVVATVANERGAVRAAAQALLTRMGQKLEEETDLAKPAELRVNPDLENVFGM